MELVWRACVYRHMMSMLPFIVCLLLAAGAETPLGEVPPRPEEEALQVAVASVNVRRMTYQPDYGAEGEIGVWIELMVAPPGEGGAINHASVSYYAGLRLTDDTGKDLTPDSGPEGGGTLAASGRLYPARLEHRDGAIAPVFTAIVPAPAATAIRLRGELIARVADRLDVTEVENVSLPGGSFTVRGSEFHVLKVQGNSVTYRMPLPLADDVDRIDIITPDGRVEKGMGGQSGRDEDAVTLTTNYGQFNPNKRMHMASGGIPEVGTVRVRSYVNPRRVTVPIDLWVTLGGVAATQPTPAATQPADEPLTRVDREAAVKTAFARFGLDESVAEEHETTMLRVAVRTLTPALIEELADARHGTTRHEFTLGMSDTFDVFRVSLQRGMSGDRTAYVTLHGGVVVFTAGRHSSIDGGIRMFGLDPYTGDIKWQKLLYTPPGETDDKTNYGGNRRINDTMLVGTDNKLDMFTDTIDPTDGKPRVDVVQDRGRRASNQFPWLRSLDYGLHSIRIGSVGRYFTGKRAYGGVDGTHFVTAQTPKGDILNRIGEGSRFDPAHGRALFRPCAGHGRLLRVQPQAEGEKRLRSLVPRAGYVDARPRGEVVTDGGSQSRNLIRRGRSGDARCFLEPQVRPLRVARLMSRIGCGR